MSSRSNASTYAEVAIEVLASNNKELTAAQIFENARKRGLLRRFTAKGRTLEQIRTSMAAKLRQSASLENNGITARQKNGVNLYSI